MATTMIETYVTKHNPDLPPKVSITGAKRDTQAGKPRYDLISPILLRRLAALLERGAAHYGERNWEKGQETSRTIASLWRHLLQYVEGAADGEDHLAAIVFNVMSLMHVETKVASGELPRELLDAPHYNAPSRSLSWAAQCIFDYMNAGNGDWYTFHDLWKAVFPNLPEQDLAKIMHGLYRRGLVHERINPQQVHPDYAVTVTAVEDRDDAPDAPDTPDYSYDGYDYDPDYDGD